MCTEEHYKKLISVVSAYDRIEIFPGLVLLLGWQYKFKLYSVMKRCFILVSHFVVIKDVEFI